MRSLEDVLGWLQAGLQDNDDLVAVQTKLEDLASWMSERKLFKKYDSDASLGELLLHVAVSLRPKERKQLGKRALRVAKRLDALEALSRSAAYDTQYEDDDAEFKRADAYWTELVELLDDLERRGLLDRAPSTEQD